MRSVAFVTNVDGHRVVGALSSGLTRRGFAVQTLVRGIDWQEADELERAIPSDLAVVTSGLANGEAVGDWLLREARGATAFYDMAPHATVAKIRSGDFSWINPRQIGRHSLYLSAAQGAVPDRIAREFGAPKVRALPVCVDPAEHVYAPGQPIFDLGTAQDDSQAEAWLTDIAWTWSGGLFVSASGEAPASYYSSLRFALDLASGPWCPSLGLLSAGLAGTPVVTSAWPGVEDFLRPAQEVLVATSPAEAAALIRPLSEEQRLDIGRRARRRVLSEHTADRRAEQFAAIVEQLLVSRAVSLR